MLHRDRGERPVNIRTQRSHQALRLTPSSDFRVKWPLLNRKLNTRDWDSQNLLMDDFAFILQESLRAELNVTPRMYQVRLPLCLELEADGVGLRCCAYRP